MIYVTNVTNVKNVINFYYFNIAIFFVFLLPAGLVAAYIYIPLLTVSPFSFFPSHSTCPAFGTGCYASFNSLTFVPLLS